MPENKLNKTKRRNKLNIIFTLFYIHYTSQKEETGLPEESTLQEISKRKGLRFICGIFYFFLDTSFRLLCGGALSFLPLGNLSHLTQERIVTGVLVFAWGHAQSLHCF